MSIFESLNAGYEPVPDGRYKLKPHQVATIRMRYRGGGITQQKLADEYGVTQPQISKIVNGKRRKQK